MEKGTVGLTVPLLFAFRQRQHGFAHFRGHVAQLVDQFAFEGGEHLFRGGGAVYFDGLRFEVGQCVVTVLQWWQLAGFEFAANQRGADHLGVQLDGVGGEVGGGQWVLVAGLFGDAGGFQRGFESRDDFSIHAAPVVFRKRGQHVPDIDGEA